MPWDAILVDLQARDGLILATVVYTDHVSKKVPIDYRFTSLTPASLKATALAAVAALDAVDATKRNFKDFQVGQPIDLTPDPPPVPDPAQVARQAFMRDWSLYQSMRRAAETGLIASDDAGTVALLASLARRFDRAYLGSL